MSIMVSVDDTHHVYLRREPRTDRPQELCESRGGRPGLPVPDEPHGFCGRKATLNQDGTATSTLTQLQRSDVSVEHSAII